MSNQLISHTKYTLQTVQNLGFDTNTTIHIYRYGISNSAENSQNSSGSTESSYSDHQNNSFSDSGFGTKFPFSFGQTQCSSRFNSSRQIAFMTSANVPFIGLETSYFSSRSSGYDQQYDQIPFKMVDEHQSFHSRDAHSPSRPQYFPLYGCQSLRLGGSSRTDESILSWSLVGRPITAPYQHVRNNGHSFHTDKSLEIYSPFLCHDSYRQHNIGLIYQQARGNTFSLPMHRGMEDTSLVHKTSEWALDQSIVNSVFQMFNYHNLDLFASRFNHKLPLCVPSSGQSGFCDRHILHELEPSPRLCISSNNNDSFCPEQDSTVSVQNSSYSTSLAATNMVLRGATSTGLSSSSSSSFSKSVNTSKRKVSTSKSPSSQPSCLGVIKQSVRNKIFSKNIADFVSKSRRTSESL